ncbi:hypothetical protein GCM10027577_34090 [Spirosoma fluminis]
MSKPYHAPISSISYDPTDTRFPIQTGLPAILAPSNESLHSPLAGAPCPAAENSRADNPFFDTVAGFLVNPVEPHPSACDTPDAPLNRPHFSIS